MTKLSKLQKFAAIKTFPNVYSSKGHDSAFVINCKGEEVIIKKQWNDNGSEAAKLGTKMHSLFEDYYNQVNQDNVDKETLEYKYFNILELIS